MLYEWSLVLAAWLVYVVFLGSYPGNRMLQFPRIQKITGTFFRCTVTVKYCKTVEQEILYIFRMDEKNEERECD